MDDTKRMSELFDCSIDNISLHLKNIFKEHALEPSSVIEYSSITISNIESITSAKFALIQNKEGFENGKQRIR